MTRATLQDAAEVIAGQGATLQDAAQAIVDGWTPGGGVDTKKVINRTDVMPVASADNAGEAYQYAGSTNASFTHGYIYENKKTATYTGTVSFEAASLSGTTVTCSGDDFANFLTESGVEPLSVVSGTMTYDAAGSLWVLVGKDSGGNTVLTFQEYQQDFEDAGFSFTGTPQDGDVVAFTCAVEEASATYQWIRVDVQPGGGGGAVDSVNGKTGVVVLKTSDLQNDSNYATVTFRTWGANE